MKIAIPSTTPDLSGRVEQKLGIAAYLLIIETEDMTYEVMDGPPPSSATGAGIQAISLIMNMGVEVLIVDFLAPHITSVLQSKGIAVIDQVNGPVADAVEEYRRAQTTSAVSQQKESTPPPATWAEALAKGQRQCFSILPVLIVVILLLGLFQGFVSQEMLLSVFSDPGLQDSLLGAVLGSLMAGSPINSYVIGDNLLKEGVGMAAVTAFMLTWVSVGIIQLPAEAAALGWRFTFVRNFAGFIMAVIMALCLSLLVGAVV